MTKPEFIYTTYIKSTVDKVWNAITNPEFTRQYWGERANASDWKKGSKWKHVDDEGGVYVGGEVLESARPKLLVLSWVDPENPADHSKVTFELEQIEDQVRLNVVHGDFQPGSIMADKVTKGWPVVLSSLKSFLETGKALNVWAVTDSKCVPARLAATA